MAALSFHATSLVWTGELHTKQLDYIEAAQILS